jgi:hypothetical protein
MFGLINNLCKRYKIFSCNTVSSQCYADYFSGGVTNVNGADIRNTTRKIFGLLRMSAPLTFVTPLQK